MKSPEPYIRRTLLPALLNHLSQPEITLIVGPRQAGKTTLMRQMEAQQQAEGRKTLWLNLDFEDDNRHFRSQSALLQRIRLEFGSAGGVVFIDEIQRKSDAGVFLKGIYDQGAPSKFVVSGSGSIELKEKINESLSGRKRLFELLPVSFREFADFRTGYRYTDRMPEYCAVEPSATWQLRQEYLAYGGYPRVILAETGHEKLAAINEIYRSYIEKDITLLLRVEKTDSFSNLVRLLAGQTGQLVNVSELSGTLGLSLPTVRNYLWYLEKTYIVRKVTPFFTNIRKEITKSPVYYFCDIGLRNFVLGLFGQNVAAESGFVFQNLIHNLLRERFPHADTTLHYWRTKDKAEVDFVIRQGMTVRPMEVKCREMQRREMQRSFRGFLERYHPQTAYIVNRSFAAQETVGTTEVRWLPWWEVMNADFGGYR
jgi:predicted AAA+ superfamily ATPase